VFKQQVEGLWEYLADSGVIKTDVEDAPQTSHSGDIHIHGPVTGSVIQQGSQNTATLNYQADVQKVLDEMRPTLNAAKLSYASFSWTAAAVPCLRLGWIL